MTKKEAVEEFVQRRFAGIPTEWVNIVAQSYMQYHSFPMWGTMWFVDSYWGERLWDKHSAIIRECEDHFYISDGEKPECDACDRYNEEMYGERVILDKDGHRTASIYMRSRENTSSVFTEQAGISMTASGICSTMCSASAGTKRRYYSRSHYTASPHRIYNRRVTKYEIAKKLGVSHQAVYKWFSGKSLPSAQHLVALSKLLKKDSVLLLKEFSKKRK